MNDNHRQRHKEPITVFFNAPQLTGQMRKHLQLNESKNEEIVDWEIYRGKKWTKGCFHALWCVKVVQL